MTDLCSVLILEDDENLRELLADILEGEGVSAKGVPSASEAVEAFLKSPYDIVLADVRMAGDMDGLGALEVLKGRFPELRCIVMTGFTDDDAPMRALRIEVDDYLYKPFTQETLLQAIESVRRPSRLQKLTESIFGNPFEQAWEGLLKARSAVFKQLHIAIRSKMLTPDRLGTPLQIWDELAGIEDAFLLASKDKRALAVPAIRKGVGLYEDFQQTLQKRLAQAHSADFEARAPDRVSRLQMKTLIERVAAGVVTLEDLHMAVLVYKMPPARRDADEQFASVYRKLWEVAR